MTDVNIAVAILTDAFHDLYGAAILVSADGDLVRPVTTILERFPKRRVVVTFPPGRHSDNLRSNATVLRNRTQCCGKKPSTGQCSHQRRLHAVPPCLLDLRRESIDAAHIPPKTH